MTRMIGAPTLDDALSALAREVSAAEGRGEGTLVFCEDSLTLLAERAVLAESGATFLTEVTTFARFLAGARQVLSKQGSVAAVSSILSECAGELTCFSVNAAEAVYETLAQLSASRVGSAELREGAQKAEGKLAGKLRDLALILEKYSAFLRERGLLDESGYLALLPEKLSSGAVKEKNVVFFGFTSFTKQAAEGIRAAVRCARSVTGIFPAGEEAFYTNESVRVFRAACAEAGETAFSALPSTLAGEAEALRKGVFSAEPHAVRNARCVHYFTAQDEAEEARAVCSLIRRHIDGGGRFSDMVVLSPASAFPVFEKYFAAYRIPYYADVKRPFSRHPFCAFTLAVLRAVSDGGLPASVDAVAANVCFGEGSVYRNYLAKYGCWRGAYRREIRTDAAEFAEDVPALCASRERMTGILGVFARKGTGADYVQGVRTLLHMVKAEETSERLAAHFSGAERDFLSLSDLEGMLSEIGTVAGERTFSAREFAALFGNAADSMKMAMIPVLSDVVFLGDATKSRFARAKVLFLTGATDALPVTGEDTAVITDGEIARLGAQGVEIEPAIAVVNARAREALALNACAFSDALFLSRPLRSGGEEAAEGELYSSVRALFVSAPLPELFPYTCSERVPALLELLREGSDFEEGRTHDARVFPSLWAALSARGEGDVLRDLTQNAQKQPVPEAARISLAGDVSPTLLENYFDCPYAGFLRNVLRLHEREEGAVRAVDTGNFVHDVLSRLAVRFNGFGAEEEAADAARAAAEELLSSGRYGTFDGEAGAYTRGRLTAECVAIARAVYASLRGSAFAVRSSEEALRLPGLGVAGKADRVDEAGGFVRVIDYKTGSFGAKPVSYYTGRSLQLELYLLAAAQGEKPAGAFYFPAQDKFSSEKDTKFRMEGFYCHDEEVMSLLDPSRAKKSVVFDSSPSSGMGAEEFAAFLGYADKVVRRAQEELRGGNISPSPYAGECAYCAFRGACGFVGTERSEKDISCAEIARIAAKEGV